MTTIQDRAAASGSGADPSPGRGATGSGPVRSRPWRYAVAGAAAAVSGIGVGHLVAAVVNPQASPVVSVGSVVVDGVPTPVKEWAVSTFGTADKAVLLTGVVVVTLAVAAGIGVLSRRRLTPALILLTVLAALPALAAMTRASAAPPDIVPGVATAITGLLVLRWLHRLAGGETRTGTTAVDAREAPSVIDSPTTSGATARRTFLIGSAGTVAGAAALGVVGQGLSRPAAPVLGLPTPAQPLAPLPAGVETTVPRVSPFRTPTSDFYRIDTRLAIPRIGAPDWKLSIDGMVDSPFEIGVEDLLAMPMIERDITMCCVSNEVGGRYIGAARWLGVPVRTLLERAGIRDGADQILTSDGSGFTISTPTQALTDDRDALLAVGMNGEPLTAEHGYPVRMVTPGLYGFTGSMKWITSMTATTYADDAAYWTQRGWATDGRVLTQARIDTPDNGTPLTAGTAVAIGGVAWAQGRGITGVEVQVDDGEWQRATLGPDAGIDYWRQWYLRWTPEEGDHRLRVRGVDGDGDVQPDGDDPPYPRGATGWHTVEVSAG